MTVYFLGTPNIELLNFDSLMNFDLMTDLYRLIRFSDLLTLTVCTTLCKSMSRNFLVVTVSEVSQVSNVKILTFVQRKNDRKVEQINKKNRAGQVMAQFKEKLKKKTR